MHQSSLVLIRSQILLLIRRRTRRACSAYIPAIDVVPALVEIAPVALAIENSSNSVGGRGRRHTLRAVLSSNVLAIAYAVLSGPIDTHGSATVCTDLDSVHVEKAIAAVSRASAQVDARPRQ